jgi:hypothetical protein
MQTVHLAFDLDATSQSKKQCRVSFCFVKLFLVGQGFHPGGKPLAHPVPSTLHTSFSAVMPNEELNSLKLWIAEEIKACNESEETECQDLQSQEEETVAADDSDDEPDSAEANEDREGRKQSHNEKMSQVIQQLQAESPNQAVSKLIVSMFPHCMQI